MQSVTRLKSGRAQNEPRIKIIVVDDIATNRSVLISLLTTPECEVLEAADGDAALELIERQAPDLVILDVLMPGLSGTEVLERIRARHSRTELPVLILSVKDDTTDVVKALEIGANDYVTRPFAYTILTTRVNTLIAYKQTHDTIKRSHSRLESRIAERTNELVSANRALQAEVIERQQVEERLRVNQERYRTLYNDTPAMFFTLDLDGQVLSVNEFGADYLGRTVENMVGTGIATFHLERDQKSLRMSIQNCVNRRDSVHRWESCMLHRDGSRIWVRTAARFMPRSRYDSESILLVCEDITEAHSLSKQLHYQAKHDALTGLVNRYEFERRLQELLDDSRAHHTEHALLYMDMDNFKVINDTHGHDAGDVLLRQLGKVLRERIGRTDTLARLGGDEFAALLCNCDLDSATDKAHALRRVVMNFRFVWRDARFDTSVSIGLVQIRAKTDSMTSLLSAADAACYSAKEEGPNHIHVYRPGDKEVVRRHHEMTWIAKIDKALSESRFELFYQQIAPIGRGVAGHGEHFELLLRMRDEQGRIVRPGAFLPAAERYKYSTKLDRWVVKHTFLWLSRRPGFLERLSLCSINLSGHTIGDNEFRKFLLGLLRDSSIPPEKLCFELTETATIANLPAATRIIDEIRDWGCRFALDDFGTGLSSFEYLKTLPVDFIKIDGQFICNIVTSPIDYTMVKAIHQIAKVMSKQTIAEYVGTQAVLETLTEIGIDFAQGNVIAPPRPLATLAA